MKNPFRKDTGSFKAETPLTPYQKAQQEWDDRIGSARVQARNWRLLSILSLLVSIFLLIALLVDMSTNKPKLFVAHVNANGQVMNVQLLATPYQPTVAQQEYFISHFIELIRTIPLDPVVAKKNWVNAYSFLTTRGAERLNAFFRQNNPIDLLGKKTVSVKVVTINPISDKSFEVEWVENIVDANGQNEGQKNYAGIFTVEMKQPTTQEEILQNPLGIYVVDFSISQKSA